ncbi:Ammonium transporter 1 [Orchesella cincta]|uniref:Ammonium transporter n=1 Tax=Orchesella cincta TaxID=48709 RepID=A0A1D2N742_ORCCI|nr:Ammonium transporter 1 [Orchesella cincta]
MDSVTPVSELVTGVANLLHNATMTEQYNPGDVAWTIACSALVWLMVPGIGYFYSGMAESQSALSLLLLCFWSIAVVSVQWFFIGYTLSFSESGSAFIGDFRHALLIDIEKGSNPCNRNVPAIVFCLYQQMLAGITPALVIGATADRGRFLPTVVFMFLWTTFVYDFLACWTWADHGWMKKWGVLDFAGGTPIHIAAGAAAIAYAKILGYRETNRVTKPAFSMVQVCMGTALIWFGWFGFNGGSVHGANARSAMVIMSTNLSASFGGITWAFCEFYKEVKEGKEGKFSARGFCFGAVAGLVCITPASGFIAPWAAVIFGIIGSLSCLWAIQLKVIIEVDDVLDVAAVHGVGGLVGTVLTGIFAQNHYATLDGLAESTIDGGWLDGNWIQVVKQFAGGCAGLAWSLIVTYLILWVMNKIPGLQLRLDPTSLKRGLDRSQLGETASYIKISDEGGLGGPD